MGGLLLTRIFLANLQIGLKPCFAMLQLPTNTYWTCKEIGWKKVVLDAFFSARKMLWKTFLGGILIRFFFFSLLFLVTFFCFAGLKDKHLFTMLEIPKKGLLTTVHVRPNFTWVISMSCWAFKLIPKALNGTFTISSTASNCPSSQATWVFYSVRLLDAVRIKIFKCCSLFIWEIEL